jgi:putative dehydrogenase
MNRSIAVVGLGAMGFPMSQRLMQAGFKVAGFDRDTEAAQSVCEAVRGAEALLLLVVNAEQAEDVLFGAGGAAGAMQAGAVVLLSLTGAPESAAKIGARLAGHGLRMVDAPVSGGVKRATAGTLTVMAAGPPADVEAARPFLTPLGEVFEIGPRHGQASTVKLINQLLCGVHLAAAAEAVALAERAGVDPRLLYKVVNTSSGASRMFADRVPMMLGEESRTTAVISILLKDLSLVGDLAASVGAKTPAAHSALGVFREAASAGLAALNDSEIIRRFRAG